MKHDDDHGVQHESDHQSVRSHSYSELGHHHHGHTFMNPREYIQSRKDFYTQGTQSKINDDKSKIDLYKMKTSARQESAGLDSPIRNLEKACAFPLPIVYVNRKNTKELMFHDSLSNFEEFEDEFVTVG